MGGLLKNILIAILVFVGTASSAHAITGPSRGLNGKLIWGLRKLEKRYGTVHITPHGGCRRHGNGMAPRSYHRYAAGCKAADVYIRGVNKNRILRWWARNIGGGTGYYCGRSFVHVDVGPRRNWTWFCGRRRKR